MNNDIINSAFTFGVFLIVVGIAGRFFDWNQANVIFIMGIAFEIFALVLFLYKKNKNR